jgi:hypothetical protein
VQCLLHRSPSQNVELTLCSSRKKKSLPERKFCKLAVSQGTMNRKYNSKRGSVSLGEHFKFQNQLTASLLSEVAARDHD